MHPYDDCLSVNVVDVGLSQSTLVRVHMMETYVNASSELTYDPPPECFFLRIRPRPCASETRTDHQGLGS